MAGQRGLLRYRLIEKLKERNMYDKKQIFSQLDSLGAPRGKIVMLHSAYSKVGDFEGGPEAFLDALIEYFTEEGGLFCVPTHTWGLLGKSDLTLDMTEKYTNLGLLPRLALDRADGIRSENPTHSTVVFGERKKALEYIESEKYTETPTSPEGCYGRLYSEGGFVLLLGVTQTSNTYLHAVDEILNTPGRLDNLPLELYVKRAKGELVKRRIFMFDEKGGDISLKFDVFSDAFLHNGAIKQGKVGDAPVILCDAVKQKNVVEMLYKRSGRDVLADNEPISPEIYKNLI